MNLKFLGNHVTSFKLNQQNFYSVYYNYAKYLQQRKLKYFQKKVAAYLVYI